MNLSIMKACKQTFKSPVLNYRRSHFETINLDEADYARCTKIPSSAVNHGHITALHSAGKHTVSPDEMDRQTVANDDGKLIDYSSTNCGDDGGDIDIVYDSAEKMNTISTNNKLVAVSTKFRPDLIGGSNYDYIQSDCNSSDDNSSLVNNRHLPDIAFANVQSTLCNANNNSNTNNNINDTNTFDLICENRMEDFQLALNRPLLEDKIKFDAINVEENDLHSYLEKLDDNADDGTSMDKLNNIGDNDKNNNNTDETGSYKENCRKFEYVDQLSTTGSTQYSAVSTASSNDDENGDVRSNVLLNCYLTRFSHPFEHNLNNANHNNNNNNNYTITDVTREERSCSNVESSLQNIAHINCVSNERLRSRFDRRQSDCSSVQENNSVEFSDSLLERLSNDSSFDFFQNSSHDLDSVSCESSSLVDRISIDDDQQSNNISSSNNNMIIEEKNPPLNIQNVTLTKDHDDCHPKTTIDSNIDINIFGSPYEEFNSKTDADNIITRTGNEDSNIVTTAEESISDHRIDGDIESVPVEKDKITVDNEVATNRIFIAASSQMIEPFSHSTAGCMLQNVNNRSNESVVFCNEEISNVTNADCGSSSDFVNVNSKSNNHLANVDSGSNYYLANVDNGSNNNVANVDNNRSHNDLENVCDRSNNRRIYGGCYRFDDKLPLSSTIDNDDENNSNNNNNPLPIAYENFGNAELQEQRSSDVNEFCNDQPQLPYEDQPSITSDSSDDDSGIAEAPRNEQLYNNSSAIVQDHLCLDYVNNTLHLVRDEDYYMPTANNSGLQLVQAASTLYDQRQNIAYNTVNSSSIHTRDGAQKNLTIRNDYLDQLESPPPYDYENCSFSNQCEPGQISPTQQQQQTSHAVESTGTGDQLYSGDECESISYSETIDDHDSALCEQVREGKLPISPSSSTTLRSDNINNEFAITTGDDNNDDGSCSMRENRLSNTTKLLIHSSNSDVHHDRTDVAGKITFQEFLDSKISRPTSLNIVPHSTSGNDGDLSSTSVGSGSLPRLEEQQLGKQPPFWVPDSEAPVCMQCNIKFTLIKRKHHCRGCGQVLCSKCCDMKAKLEYMNYAEARVCHCCYRNLEKGESEQLAARMPNPNNPMEYCSTVSPLLQVGSTHHQQPPPSVLVPVPAGVLKREGKVRNSDAPKKVMFSDGIRPGGDLTEINSGGSESRISSRRHGRLTRRVGTPPGNLSIYKKLLNMETKSFIPSGAEDLPPVYLKEKGEFVYSELVKPIQTGDTPLKYAINRNLFVLVSKIFLDCCVNREVWCIVSEGLACVGQDEVVFIMETLPDEKYPPKDIFFIVNFIYRDASEGSTVTEMSFLPSMSNNMLHSKEHGGFIFIRPTSQCCQKLQLPKPPFLIGILTHRWETPWARLFPIRLVLRLGAQYRYYPCPLFSVRFRSALFSDIGHTIVTLLADFRKYAFTLPTVQGLLIHMEDRLTTILLPRNRYDQVSRTLKHSDENVLTFAGNISPIADSHLVAIQSTDSDSSYQTQAINIHNKPRKVTGASFIVFNGSLKQSGWSGKSNIIEDGLMVQIPSDSMAALRTALNQMKDYTIGCGPQAEEMVVLKWCSDDTNFNIGVKSCIDKRPLDGIPSIRVHNGIDYSGASRFIRWTEVFIIQADEESRNRHADAVNVKKLSESIGRATCMALLPYLDLLATANLNVLAVRATIDPDNVGYEAGSKGEKLPPLYMKSLDEELIKVVNEAAVSIVNFSSPVILELIFRIVEQA